MAAVDEACELNAGRPAVLEEGLDRGPDRPAGVEDVVDEDTRHPSERKVELRRLDDGLGVQRLLAAADDDVVAMKRDVDAPERDLDATEVFDQTTEPLGQRDAAGLDADERDAREVAVPLDDLMGDAGDRPAQRLRVQEDAPRIDMRSHKQLLSGLSGPS